MKKPSKNTHVGRKNNIVIQELENEILIYDLDKNKAFCLNETSANIWQLCDGNNSVSDIKEKLSKKFNSSANENLVWLALVEFKRHNLIKPDFEVPTEFTSISRRDVIKKIGFGTMITFPIVSTLVAPTSTQAASTCLAAGASCTTSSQCCSTNTTIVTPTNPNTPAQTFTGRCCRAGSAGSQPYGPSNTCVPGPSSGFTVPQGVISYNGNTTPGGQVTCK